MINRIISKIANFGRLLKFSKYISLKNVFILRKIKRYTSGKIKTKFGKIEYVDSVSFLSGMEEIFVEEIYKVNEYKTTPPVVLDCGANIGLSAIYFSEFYGAKVFAFEADPQIAKVLSRNVNSICTKGTVEVKNEAIWLDDKGVIFDVEGGYSGQIQLHGHELVKKSVRVPSIDLRTLILKVGNVDFLKLDIEGAENDVLLRCAGALRKIDYIFIEWHSIKFEPQNLGEILVLLKEEGFRYHIKDAFASKHPFVQLDEMCGMDLQLNIFAYK